jgi:hypothetical protein
MEEPHELCATMLGLLLAAVLLVGGWLYLSANPKKPPDEIANPPSAQSLS